MGARSADRTRSVSGRRKNSLSSEHEPIYDNSGTRIPNLNPARGLQTFSRMINLGIVGLGPVWESRYRPVLDKLQHRVRIRAVFDPVASRADEVAATLRAASYQGVLALMSHADIRGILLLDSSWYGKALIHFLRHARKPVYIAGSLGEDWDELSRLRSLVESEGLLLMPEFSRRFTPATCRLHELIATRLGRPRHIAIDAVSPAPDSPDAIPGQKAGTDFLVGLLDWCRYVIRSTTVRLEAQSLDPAVPTERPHHRVAIEFGDAREQGRGRSTAELVVRHPVASGAEPVLPPTGLCFTVLCEKGEAVIEGPAQIRWTLTGGETATESLTADRSEVEVMIDHFCRRLVGGLIPVADISDVCRSLRLVHATRQSLASSAPIPLNGDYA
jgi:predicted dehydrogenase